MAQRLVETSLVGLMLALILSCEVTTNPLGGNQAPTATISAPAEGTTYRGGDAITYSGSATDPEEGALPPARLAWWADFHHDTHTHPFLPLTTGSAGGTVTIPTVGETAATVWYRFYLVAVDANGAADTVIRDILPRTATLTLATVPPGLQLTLDGQPRSTPLTVTGVVGIARELGVVSPQTVGTIVYTFTSWSDGGAATHTVSTPAANTAYTATYTATNSPPSVSLTAPANGGSAVVNTPVTVSANASDADGTVTGVEFFDGATSIGTDATSPYSITWMPTTTGTRNLTARATDNLLAVTTSAPVSFTVTATPNTPPSVSLTAPATGGSALVNTPVTVSADATDSDGTVTGVEFFDGTTSIGTDATSPYSITWTPTTTGTRNLTARATDNLLATTTSAPVSFTVTPPPGSDTEPPTATLTAPADQATGLTGALTLIATATDNVGVAGVRFQVDGVDLGAEDAVAPYEATLPATNAYTTGVHVLRARARDAAGNVSPWSVATVTFGNVVNMPAGFSRSTYTSGLLAVTAMAFAPDGRLFICQQNGELRVVPAGGGAPLATPFHTFTVTNQGEQGLLGIAFHPSFTSNGFVYVYYTSPTPNNHNRISRIVASAGNPNVSTGVETFMLDDLPPVGVGGNHNGGALHFSPIDGKLYVAIGEQGTASNAPSMTSRFGKILRYNDDLTIPTDNPFFGTATGVYRAIWALGLRNPFTFAFQPGTGRMFINDVGQNTWEEVNEGIAGSNYGWPTTEGPTTDPRFRAPIYAYVHSGGLVSGNAIVGAAFYNTSAATFPPSYVGTYFFGDYVDGWINRLDPSNGNAVYAFARTGSSVFDLKVGPDGALYALSRGTTFLVYRYQFP